MLKKAVKEQWLELCRLSIYNNMGIIFADGRKANLLLLKEDI